MRTPRQIPDPQAPPMVVALTLTVIRSPIWWPGDPGFRDEWFPDQPNSRFTALWALNQGEGGRVGRGVLVGAPGARTANSRPNLRSELSGLS